MLTTLGKMSTRLLKVARREPVACIAIALFLLAGATTGLTARQILTAQPSVLINLANSTPLEGTSTALMRSDATLGVTGTLPETRGGTGAGVLNCTAGQFLTSNGTLYSCGTPPLGWPPPILGSVPLNGGFAAEGNRVGWWFVSDPTLASFTAIGLPGGTLNTTGANGTIVADNPDGTHAMVKLNIVAASTYVSLGSNTGIRRCFQPRITFRLYVYNGMAPSGTGNRALQVGFASGGGNVHGLGSPCSIGAAGGSNGAWICADDWNGNVGGGVNWIFSTNDNANTGSTDTGVAVTTGLHTFSIECDQITMNVCSVSIDGGARVTRTTNLPSLAPDMGPSIWYHTSSAATTAAVSVSGFQVSQNF